MKKFILASILGLTLSGSYAMAGHCDCDKCKDEKHECKGHDGKKCDCKGCADKGGSCSKEEKH